MSSGVDARSIAAIPKVTTGFRPVTADFVDVLHKHIGIVRTHKASSPEVMDGR